MVSIMESKERLLQNLDAQICHNIRDIIQKTEKSDAIPIKFFQW